MIPSRIRTSNFYTPGRNYFENIIRPIFEKTQALKSPTEKRLIIAGKHIHLYIYGDAAERVFLPAFSHQEISRSTPDLTIHAWDYSITHSDPVLPWNSPGHAVDTFDTSFLSTYVGGEESISFYDTKTHTAYFSMHDASKLSDWSTGAPFRAILHWFLEESGMYLVHGAAIGFGGASILLTGKSGSGKSTTALSCLLSGMEYLGDDYVAVGSTDTTQVHSLYNSAKVTPEGLTFFPELKKYVWNKSFSENEKAVVFLSDVIPGQIKTVSSLKAVLIPRIGFTETKIMPATKIEALIALAPTTLFQLPLANTIKLSILKKLLEHIPCYYLNLGPDIHTIPDVIKNFLKDHE